jgi:hypothetical protein
MNDLDWNNRIEIEFDTQAAEPAFSVNSVDNAAITSMPPANDVFDSMTTVYLRVTKAGDEYHVYVNGISQAVITNSGLGDTTLRPYVTQYSCSANTTPLNTSIDLVELLLDRDADGLADLHEDSNVNGTVDPNESDPLNPDADGDSVLDGHDNCLLKSNAVQRDTNADGYGNLCDPDFNNNGVVDPGDFSLLKSLFGQPGFPDQDLNGNGIVDPFDFSTLKSMFGQPPGPSGVVP